MTLTEYLESGGILLTEGSVYEKIRRSTDVSTDPHIANASLIYDPVGKDVLRSVVEQYLEIGQRFNLPMLCLTNTWRANPERIARSSYSDRSVNKDCVLFYRDLIDGLAPMSPIYLGGLIGFRGDAYKAQEALGTNEAYVFHQKQVCELASSGVDFLYASTLPARSEALGIARAMSETETPYMLSFVIRANATLLDGSSLNSVVKEIDAIVDNPPIRFMINCTY